MHTKSGFLILFCGLLVAMGCHVDVHPPKRRSQFGQNDRQAVNPVQTVQLFLNWCKSSTLFLDRIPVEVNLKNHGVYYVDKNLEAQYITRVRSSGFFSPKYIQDLTEYIDLCDANLKKHPQSDFVVAGFAGNLVTKMMDDMDIMEHLDSLRFSIREIFVDTIEIGVRGPNGPARDRMTVLLSKTGNSWKIDAVNGPFKKIIQ